MAIPSRRLLHVAVTASLLYIWMNACRLFGGTLDDPIRVAVNRLVAVRDLGNKTHTWTIHLDVTWEPGVNPLFINARPDDLVVKVGGNTVLTPLSSGAGRIAIVQPDRVEIPIRLEAPLRPADKITLLKGGYTILGSKQTLTFTFEPKKPALQSQSQDGVTAVLHEFKQTKTMWTVRIRLIYPENTPDFESFESWLGTNEIVLERKNGKGRFTPNGGYSIDDSTGKSALLTYRFLENKNLKLGTPDDWRIVFRTPGKIEKMLVGFEFRDLPAP